MKSPKLHSFTYKLEAQLFKIKPKFRIIEGKIFEESNDLPVVHGSVTKGLFNIGRDRGIFAEEMMWQIEKILDKLEGEIKFMSKLKGQKIISDWHYRGTINTPYGIPFDLEITKEDGYSFKYELTLIHNQ